MTMTMPAGHEVSVARPLLTVMETAHHLGTGKDFVYTRINEGSLPAINLGTGSRPRIRIHPDDLDAYIAQRRFG